MKIAMFSPLPPQKTGVALYTKNLINSLKQKATIDLYTPNVDFNEFESLKVYDYEAQPFLLAKLNSYDLIVYHIGNNWHFHLSIYNVLQHQPGIVILHDAVLYYLIAGQDNASFTRDFLINYGWERRNEIPDILLNSKDNQFITYPFPEKYPLLKTIINKAQAIIVHSSIAENMLRSHGYEKQIFKIPFLIYEHALNKTLNKSNRDGLLNQFSANQTEILISTLGFSSSTKRINTIFSALEEIKKHINFKLIIVGEGYDHSLKEKINSHNLQDHVHVAGYLTSDDDFFEVMLLSDIIINLRYPSMGETSSIVVQAMFFKKPCIVTDFGWFSELPSNAVFKIPFDNTEVDSLVNALLYLSRNEKARLELGNSGHQYVNENCLPTIVTKKYLEIFSRILNFAYQNV